MSVIDELRVMIASALLLLVIELLPDSLRDYKEAMLHLSGAAEAMGE